MPIISLISAISENRAIGKDNHLLCYLPADLKFFKQTTLGHYIAMGRKTHESIGKALPKRTNVVISKNRQFKSDNCLIVSSVEAAIELAKDEFEIFFIGGESIYKQVLPYADKIYITRIHRYFEGDVFFPKFENSGWKLRSKEPHRADEKNRYDYTFELYERVEKKQSETPNNERNN